MFSHTVERAFYRGGNGVFVADPKGDGHSPQQSVTAQDRMQYYLKQLTLRSFLSLCIFAVVLVTLIFGALIGYLNALEKVREEMQAAIDVGARIASNAINDVESARSPTQRLVSLIADFHGDRHLAAKWVNADGQVLMQSVPAAPSEPVPGWFSELIAKPEMSRLIALPSSFEGLGALVIETDSSNEIGEVWRDTLKTLTILALFCGLVLAMVYAVLGWALVPLTRLVEAFRSVSEGSPAQVKVPERGPQDLVEVYRGFNSMTDRLAVSERKNRRLNEQLATVQEEERGELARDLHDEVGPYLFSVDVDVASARSLIEQGREDEALARLAGVRDTVHHVQTHVRDLLTRLRTEALVDVGLSDAVDNLVDFWRPRCPDTNFDISFPDQGFGERNDAVIYRAVQEGVNNAVRHGRPSRISVSADDLGDCVRVVIRDDGKGIPTPVPAGGYGLVGMRERVESAGGEVLIRQGEGGSGTILEVLLPMADAGERTEPVGAGSVGTAQSDKEQSEIARRQSEAEGAQDI